jgi:hypothetical protein
MAMAVSLFAICIAAVPALLEAVIIQNEVALFHSAKLAQC